jgi:tRNA/rRNA methyltransferase
MIKRVVSPERAMQETFAILQAGGQVSVMFGPERAGLENDDIARADAIISVPVNTDSPSLNLAQCVLLVAYEWQRASQETVPQMDGLAKTEFATGMEIEKLGDHFEDRLTTAGFFFPQTKAEGMKQNLRNMWSRLPLTRADVQSFHGMLRQMVRWRERDD